MTAQAGGSLIERVRSGSDPELRRLAARGLLPLPPAELLPLQVELARGAAPALAEAARASLLAADPRVVADHLARDASPRVQAWFAAESGEPRVVEALLRRRDVPREILVELAPRLPAALQELLVHRQDALVDEPAIADALEANPELSAYVRRRIGEYREHLLRPAGRPRAAPAEGEEGEPGEPSDEELARALAEAAGQPALGEAEPETKLTEAQIRYLPIPVRMRLSRGAPRTLRAILLRDPNPLVACSVLHNNTFSDDEIERIAKNRHIDEQVLSEIGRHREWSRKYRVIVALVHNSRTPLSLALSLVPRVAVRDLRRLSLDRNVPDAVRSVARRLYRIKRK